ncbi:ABC transporter permease [Jiangella alkaliphila]|uniref:Transport permease protein n=1 Tax=Jiangella alkaliphila TaxID=419479 RepID=A0A1H2K3L1_9ACTN|nr:ABC transporter permease [Jiangella alkaliphila]SDU62988.1 ABC-2 type transport system permease protein [Jiangella alkaliphila]
MSTLAYAARDSRTMLRRNMRRWARYPAMTLQLIGIPVIFLLMFAYVFGETLGAGLGGPAGDRGDYINYLVPGIIIMTVSASVQGTAISVAMDMHEGIIARFRTMAISRGAVLTGHVIGSFLQTLVGMVIVTGTAFAIGFRTNANAAEWLGAIGLLSLFAIALTWLAVGMGLQAKSVETASNVPTLLVLLPFLGSGFVPADSMPAGLRWFAEYQPFSPVIETVRGLLLGGLAGRDVALALGWTVALGVLGYFWSLKLFRRPPVKG